MTRSTPGPVLFTDRTRLDPFAGEDVGELLGVFRNPVVRRWLLDDAEVSREWVEGEVEASAGRFAQSGAGLWAVRVKAASTIAGFVGFRGFFDPPRLQLLYGLLPEYHGRGLATEVAARVCRHAFEELAMTEVLAAIDTPNRASAGVLDRLGFQMTRETDEGVAGTQFFELRPEGARP